MTGEAERLREARRAAGFGTAQEAAARFGWTYPTYAGHENGSRGIRREALRIYARAFRVDLSWLMEGTGRGPGTALVPDQTLPAGGFSESDAAPFLPSRPGQERSLRALADDLAPGLRHRLLYVARQPCPAFAILRGDVLVIGTPKQEEPGDVVVVTLALPGPSDARTVLRQRIGAAIVAPVGASLPDEASRTVGILGTVAAVIRARIFLD